MPSDALLSIHIGYDLRRIHSHKTRHGGRGRPVPLSQTDCDRPVGTSAERSKRTLKRVEYKSASTAGHHRQASVDARSTQDPRSDRSPGQLSALSLGQMDVAFGGFQPCKDDAVNGRCAQIAAVPRRLSERDKSQIGAVAEWALARMLSYLRFDLEIQSWWDVLKEVYLRPRYRR